MRRMDFEVRILNNKKNITETFQVVFQVHFMFTRKQKKTTTTTRKNELNIENLIETKNFYLFHLDSLIRGSMKWVLNY